MFNSFGAGKLKVLFGNVKFVSQTIKTTSFYNGIKQKKALEVRATVFYGMQNSIH